jgi:hypothetical protein
MNLEGKLERYGRRILDGLAIQFGVKSKLDRYSVAFKDGHLQVEVPRAAPSTELGI